MIYVFDIEVFRHNWLVVFKNYDTKEYTVIHNDNELLADFISRQEDILLAAFNNKHYDNHILKALLLGADNAEVKNINDFILTGYNGWEHPFFIDKPFKYWFDSFDLKDDMQPGLSLKSIEAHLGLPIKESTVDFDIDRPLTRKELIEVVEYCKYDVDMVEKLISLRERYLNTKIRLGKMRNIPDRVSLYCTNAKIVAKYLLAERVERDDGREYEYPPNLNLNIIPKEVLDFFDQIHDESISDEDLFSRRLDIDIGNCPTRFAWGGVHGSLKAYHQKSTEDIIIQNRDIESYYPALMIEYDYVSRNIPDKEIFRETRDIRIKLKHEGHEDANTLKLPLNTASGAAENIYNDLYDPKQARGMRISGQLFITELVMSLIKHCSTFKLINFNTDGFMYSIDKKELSVLEEICEEWEIRTRFNLETDDIKEVWVKDVNNLLSVKNDGSIHTVGGYLNYGISDKGAWSINNNHTIVKQAVIEYFTKGIPLEETINNCNDLLSFQIIAHASSKYSHVYHYVNGEKIEVQKTNRVYAAHDKNYGTLVKVHKERGNDNKISGLPDNCIIDNNNILTINDIDKSWYIKLAQKYVNDYLGVKPRKVNTRKINAIKKKILKELEV